MSRRGRGRGRGATGRELVSDVTEWRIDGTNCERCGERTNVLIRSVETYADGRHHTSAERSCRECAEYANEPPDVDADGGHWHPFELDSRVAAACFGADVLTCQASTGWGWRPDIDSGFRKVQRSDIR